MGSCIFCKIRDRIIPNEFTYEDADVMVFPDICPIKPVHFLIIPKKHIEDLLMINDEARLPSPASPHAKQSEAAREGEANGGQGLMMKLMKITQDMIRKFKLDTEGYRVGVNGGGAQGINHLHIHLIGPMGKNAEMSA